MKKLINVVVIGYLNPNATKLISKLEEIKEKIFLVPKTIGKVDQLENFNLKIGISGKDIKVFPQNKMDILLEYRKNSIFVDFEKNQQRIDFYKKFNFKKIIFPEDNLDLEDIINIILVHS